MKKCIFLLALIGVLTALTCASALADSETGIRITSQVSFVEVTPQTAAGDAVTAVTDEGTARYPGAERIRLLVSGAEAEKQILVLAQTDEETPTEANLVYIDQGRSQAEGTISFVVFPKELTPVTYYVYLASDAESGNVQDRTLAVTFEYYVNEESVLVGDVDGNEIINALDALSILQHAATQIDLTDKMNIADVTNDNLINAMDALDVLLYTVGDLQEFTRKG